MTEILNQLSKLHSNKRLDLELWQVDINKEYAIYRDLIFKDEQMIEEYLMRNFDGNIEKEIEENVEYKKGDEIIREYVTDMKQYIEILKEKTEEFLKYSISRKLSYIDLDLMEIRRNYGKRKYL